MYNVPADFINEQKIWDILEANKNAGFERIKEVLAKAKLMKGLNLEDVAVLTGISDPEMLAELFNTANEVKETIYGKRLVLFAPLYISNLCANECLYCAFRATNKDIVRNSLSQEHIAREVEVLIKQGHKRILMVAGESYPNQGFQYVLDSIKTIYSVKTEHGEIRRNRPASEPTRFFRKLTTAKLTVKFIWAGKNAIITGAPGRCTGQWKPESMMWELEFCLACSITGLKF